MRLRYVVGAALLVLSSVAYAKTDFTLKLAQTCVAEVTFWSTAECVVMWDIQKRKAEARNKSLEQQVEGYHSIWKRTKRGGWIVQSPRTKWIRALEPHHGEPLGFSEAERTQWDGERWMAVYGAAHAFLSGDTLSPCPDADEYGGDCEDGGKASCDPPKPCWVRVDCGDTAQAYWSTKRCRNRGAVIPAAVAGARDDGIW